MRPNVVARLLVTAAAIAVAVVLIGADRSDDRCDASARSAYLASRAPAPELERHVGAVIADCSGSEPLTHLAIGLRIQRPAAAARLAREATRREPDSYTAWAVLSIAGLRGEAAMASRRARALNPLSAAAGGP